MISQAKKVLTASALLFSTGLMAGFMYWPHSPIDLGEGNNMTKSGLYSSWDVGNVVVLVRHAERCDRSSHPCLDEKDGITELGGKVSMDIGMSFKDLGLDHADILSSPRTRTTQTARYLFGHSVDTQEWLDNCDSFALDDVVAHKASHRNLILVTHSGCISRLESQQGYTHAENSGYSSALFLTLDAQGKATIQGVLNPEGWEKIPKRNNY